MNGLNDNYFVEKFVPNGEKNAVSQKALARVLNVELREVRLLVEQARRRGVPICSGSRGYYMPENADEALDYLKIQKKRIRTAKAVMKPVEKYICEHSGQ